MADAWDEYLARRNAGQLQQPQQPAHGLFSLFNLGGNSNNLAGPGQPITTTKQGMYTPGIQMQQAGPATPIDYTRIRSLLSSGALRNGGQVNDPGPTPTPEQPQAVEPPKTNPLQAILSRFFGGL